MVYVAAVLVLSVIVGLAMRRKARQLTMVGVVAGSVGIASVAIAAVTGNLLLLYLGEVLEMFAVTALCTRAVVACTSR